MTTLRNVDASSPTECSALIALALTTGLFTEEEAEHLLGATLDGIASGALSPPSHAARLALDPASGRAVGWTYTARDEHAEGVFELMWIGVGEEEQGRGAGKLLLLDAEDHARRNGGRLMLVCTSSQPATERARAFYERRGYAQCGRIPNFYAEGDDKVIFVKQL